MSADEPFTAWLMFTLPIIACAILAAVFVLHCHRYPLMIRCSIAAVPMLIGIAAATAHKVWQLQHAAALAGALDIAPTFTLSGVALQTIPWAGFAVGLAAVAVATLIRTNTGQPSVGATAATPRASA